MSDILIKLPKETFLEILKQVPLEDLEAIIRERRIQVSPLQQQLERAQVRVKPFSIKDSPFFSLPSIDLGETSAEDLDRIITEDAYRAE